VLASFPSQQSLPAFFKAPIGTGTDRESNQPASPPPLSAARKKRKSKYIPEEIAKTDPFMGKHDYADENMYTFFIDTYLSLSLIIN
jgi:hypothetical protein